MGIGITITSKQTSETRKRLTKLRSVKVVSLDRSRLSLKRKKSGLSQKLILTDEMSKQACTSELPASPNYMKATSCSNAKRGSLQPNSGDGSVEIRSAKRIFSLKKSKKKSTTKSRLSYENEIRTPCLHLNAFESNRVIFGDSENSFDTPNYLGRGAEASIQLIRSGSIKLRTRRSVKVSRRQWSKSRFNKALIFRTDDESPQEVLSMQGNDIEGMIFYCSNKNQVNNSVDAPGLKPVRALWKIPSLKHRRLLIKKQSRKHDVGRARFDIATCSSTIHSSKFVDIDSARNEGYSIGQVCHYTYCSIHGNPHISSPSLKKKKSRQRKYKSLTAKRQKQEVTSEYHADPSLENAPEASGNSESSSAAGAATDIVLYKQGCTNMWNLIYNHFSVHGSELTSEVSETGRDEEDPYTRDAEIFNYKQKQLIKDHETNMRSQVTESEKTEFSQAEAVEFVKHAVDEILLLDEQLSFRHPRDLNYIHQVNDSENRRGTEDSGEIKFPKPPSSKGFTKIRKLVATTKFIRVMEKLRKDSAAHAPKNLFLKPHFGEETALLRHLTTNKRKGSEEWMLDVALQHVITKLDPIQQRRVGMLIEAFESVKQDTHLYSTSESIVQEPNDKVKCYATVTAANGEDHVKVEQAESVSGTALHEDENSKDSLDVESRGGADDGGTKSGGLPFDDSQGKNIKLGDLSRIPEEEMIIIKDVEKLAAPTKGNQEIDSNFQSTLQTAIGVCKVDDSVGINTNFHFDKAKFTNVWHQVYHRFIGSEATYLGNEKNNGIEVKQKNVDQVKHDAESCHLNQVNAIQLVQEAINGLIHIQEQLSEQLFSQVSEHDITHNNEEEQFSSEFAKENLGERDKVGREEACSEVKDIQKAETAMRESNGQIRKMVVSSTFVKAMEKVRNPYKPQNVALEAESEAERAYRRNWRTEDRRISEESLIDYALEEVIAKLSPTQQKKVAITQALEAFSSEIQQISKGCSVKETQPVYDSTLTKITENEHNKSIVLGQDNPDVYNDDIKTPDDEVPSFLADSSKTNSLSEQKNNEALDAELDMELYYSNVELSGVNLHIHELGSKERCPVCDFQKFPKEDKEENKFNIDLQLEASTDDSEQDCNVPKDVQEKRNNCVPSLELQRWNSKEEMTCAKPDLFGDIYPATPASAFVKESSAVYDLGDSSKSYDGNEGFIIYQHNISGIPEKVQKRMQGEISKNKLVQGERTSFKLRPSSSKIDRLVNMEIQDSDINESKLLQNVAIKLVREAVYEILQMPDQPCDDDQLIISEHQSLKEVPRIYNTMSQVILCKKFIKALEKMKKQRSKSIHPKQQKENEMKNDQQVIGDLAPAQKKKVSTLVEAFERVALLPEVEQTSPPT